MPASASNIQRLSSTFSPELARWAFGQWELRTRARSKFSRASEMLFVKEALEQSTHRRVAEYHASLFPGGELVVDLACGIGGDTIALAARGPILAFELDADRARYAAHNLSVYGVSADIQVANSLESDWQADYIFADPSRRVEGRRTLDLDEFSPSPRAISELFETKKLGVMKLSPLLADSDLEGLGPRLEFISYGRECREVLVIGGTGTVPGRVAVHLESGTVVESGIDPLPAEEVGEALYEVDPAVVRAHGVGTLADEFELAQLGEHPGYLTGPIGAMHPCLTSFRILDSGRYDPKRLREVVRSQGFGRLELKQKGADLDLTKLSKQLAGLGSKVGTFAFWKEGQGVRWALLKPQ